MLEPSANIALYALSLFCPSATQGAWGSVAGLDSAGMDIAIPYLIQKSLVIFRDQASQHEVTPLAHTYLSDLLLTSPDWMHSCQLRFCRYWVDYAEKNGSAPRESHRTYDRLEAESKNLESVANILWERSLGPLNLTCDPIEFDASDADAVEVVDTVAATMLVDLVRALSQYLRVVGQWDQRVLLSQYRYVVSLGIQDWESAGWAAFDIALINMHRLATDIAEKWAHHADSAWACGSNRTANAFSHRLGGLIARQRRQYAIAQHHFEASLRAFREFDELKNIGILLNDLGDIASDIGDYESARQRYQEALEIAKRIGDREAVANRLWNIGDLQLRQRDFAEAEIWLNQALATAREVGRAIVIAECKRGLAAVYVSRDQKDAAISAISEALLIYKQLKHPKEVLAASRLAELTNPPLR